MDWGRKIVGGVFMVNGAQKLKGVGKNNHFYNAKSVTRILLFLGLVYLEHGDCLFYLALERLFPLIQGMYPELAGKITGMLLEIDNSELVHMLESQESLKGKVEEAVTVLQVHQSKE
jgi:hypothetical protein